ncbi:MAG: LPS export ABC transporter periplasmic protein LptC [Arenimonas sp.]
MKRPLMLTAVLLGVAAIAGVAVWQLRPVARPGGTSVARSDYILHNFELTSLDVEGNEAFSVSAPYLERDPGGKSMSMRLPRFQFPDRKEGRWLATSDRAWIADRGVEVRLIEKVEMTGPPSPLGDSTRFETTQLNVFPKQDLALSEEPVTVTRAGSILRGTGLRADMKTHHIQLLANVKGRYAPRRP